MVQCLLMRFARITLFGFLLTVLCASFCPMNTGIAQAKGCHGAAEAQEEDKSGCDHCESHDTSESLSLRVISKNDFVIQAVSPALPVAILDLSSFIKFEPRNYIAVSDPPLDVSLIRTVVLLT